mmetsp:Transcript_122788/g.354943  ORF Transcript_122788/g.354943 Transcript_122788/m.354943 type:complete len:204 (-) Transcript_122788:270-881(-)
MRSALGRVGLALAGALHASAGESPGAAVGERGRQHSRCTARGGRHQRSAAPEARDMHRRGLLVCIAGACHRCLHRRCCERRRRALQLWRVGARVGGGPGEPIEIGDLGGAPRRAGALERQGGARHKAAAQRALRHCDYAHSGRVELGRRPVQPDVRRLLRGDGGPGSGHGRHGWPPGARRHCDGVALGGGLVPRAVAHRRPAH